jgi:hypothetical protein
MAELEGLKAALSEEHSKIEHLEKLYDEKDKAFRGLESELRRVSEF